MQVDPEDLKKFVQLWFAQLRRVEAELLAHVAVVGFFAQSDPTFDMKSLLDAARKTPTIERVLADKYDEVEREVLESIDKGSWDQALLQRLREWKPKGSVN